MTTHAYSVRAQSNWSHAGSANGVAGFMRDCAVARLDGKIDLALLAVHPLVRPKVAAVWPDLEILDQHLLKP
jgi:hypothetical protein